MREKRRFTEKTCGATAHIKDGTLATRLAVMIGDNHLSALDAIFYAFSETFINDH